MHVECARAMTAHAPTKIVALAQVLTVSVPVVDLLYMTCAGCAAAMDQPVMVTVTHMTFVVFVMAMVPTVCVMAASVFFAKKGSIVTAFVAGRARRIDAGYVVATAVHALAARILMHVTTVTYVRCPKASFVKCLRRGRTVRATVLRMTATVYVAAPLNMILVVCVAEMDLHVPMVVWITAPRIAKMMREATT